MRFPTRSGLEAKTHALRFLASSGRRLHAPPKRRLGSTYRPAWQRQAFAMANCLSL